MLSSTDAIAAWAAGYTRSRGYAAPVPDAWGLRFDPGLPDQVRRHARLCEGTEGLAAMICQVTDPFVFIEVLDEPAIVAPLLPEGWVIRSPAWLMTTALARDAGAGPPSGYDAETRAADDTLVVEIRAADGHLAASGRAGLAGGVCVFDQIFTDADHRRRGLGRAVMGALSAGALALDCPTGVLIATEDGRALYASLGWRELTPVTSVISP